MTLSGVSNKKQRCKPFLAKRKRNFYINFKKVKICPEFVLDSVPGLFPKLHIKSLVKFSTFRSVWMYMRTYDEWYYLQLWIRSIYLFIRGAWTLYWRNHLFIERTSGANNLANKQEITSPSSYGRWWPIRCSQKPVTFSYLKRRYIQFICSHPITSRSILISSS